MNLEKLILASGSPRRAEILNAVGWEFEKIVADVDESVRDGESPRDYVARLSLEKARAVALKNVGKIVLGADTTVVLNNEIIGKPLDLDDARQMLRRLSGQRHFVLTGVTLFRKNADQTEQILTEVQKTAVLFSDLSDENIEFLVNYGAPLDKAGGYAVQAQAALFIESIEGDYWNVVGLPVSKVWQMFQQF